MADKIITDYGVMLKDLRLRANISRRQLGKQVGVTENVIASVENGKYIPEEHRLRKWLRALGCQDSIPQLIALSRQFKINQSLRLIPKDQSNPDMMRLLEAYRNKSLSVYDRSLLALLARG